MHQIGLADEISEAAGPGKLGGAAGLAQSAMRRTTMVDCQIRPYDVTDQRLLARMLEVPREDFLPSDLASFAYSDAGLPLSPAKPGAENRRLLAPLVLARLLQGAGVVATDHVLDAAPATGYSTALLAGLAESVVALESDPSLYRALRSNLDAFGLAQVKTILGPLPGGAPDDAPFDVIVLHGAAEANLDALFSQLKEGGRLVCFKSQTANAPMGTRTAVRYEKVKGTIGYRVLFDASAPALEAFKKAPEFTF